MSTLFRKADASPEYSQSLTRVVLVLLICAYFFYTENTLILTVTGSYLVVSLIFWVWAVVSPADNRWRRVLMGVGDIVITTVCLHFADGEDGTLFVGLYLWIIAGHGFRFGTAYAYLNMGLSVVGFSTVMFEHPFWSEHLHMAIGNLILIVILPLFIARLIYRLETAIRSAEQANKAKSDFIANMSHELRTPLNAIVGMNDLLQTTGLNSDQKRFSFVIRESSNHLLGLIERLLDFARIEAGKMEIASEPFDLHKLVHGVMAMFEGQAGDKGIAVSLYLDPQAPFELVGDPKHLKQVLINIVGNAVKFTEQGSVSLHVVLVTRDTKRVRLRFVVSDTGIGISEAVQDKIFEKFTQADGGITRRYGGTGLGTTIALNLTQMMDGEIALESREGEGSRFTVELPLTLQQTTSARELAQIHVLLLATSDGVGDITQMLERWDADYALIEDEQVLFSRLLDAASMGQPYDVAIICLEALNSKAELIARDVRDKKKLAGLDILLIDPAASMANDAARIAAGFDAVLHEPLQAPLLFNALHASSIVHHVHDSISMDDILHKQHREPAMHVLLAEDNLVNQEVVRETLQRAGHTIEIVSDGKQALDALTERDFDLVLMDMNMPKIAGLDVLKQFRIKDASAKTPVLMLSANALPSTVQECLDAGADEYLVKPVQAATLLEKVAAYAAESLHKPEVRTRSETISHPVEPAFEAGDEQELDEEVLQELFQVICDQAKRQLVIDAFINSGREHLEEIRKAVHLRDVAEFKKRIHTIKGGAATLGVRNLVALCREAEADGNSLDVDSMRRYSGMLEAHYTRAGYCLRAYLKRCS